MKRIASLLIAALMLIPTGASAWGRLGHMTIAEIAERHLTPEAKKNIEHYLNGSSLADHACWMDEIRAQKPYDTEFEGWHASICTPDCKSPLYIRKQKRNCKDGVSAMEFLRVYLKDWRELSDSTVLVGIKCMTHVIGDFHCLSHVRYTDYGNQNNFKITYKGHETSGHHFYDSILIQEGSGLAISEYKIYADRLDTWSRSQIRKAQRGWAREWFEDAAKDIEPVRFDMKKNRHIDEQYVTEHIEVAELQLRKAGYQLAAALNEIFGN